MNIYNFSRVQLATKLQEHGFKAYNALQIYEWLYQKDVADFNLMHNLNKQLRVFLLDKFKMIKPIIKNHQSDTDVDKFLLEYRDGSLVEAVLMKHNYGYSLCLSTQVGCNMNCSFCASGKLKKSRNLQAAEMVAPILLIQETKQIRISHIVLMGTGEPFDNYDEVVNFLNIINDAKGLAIGARHITVSTCGIIPKIYEFAKLPLQVNLAISLHAANDSLRTSLMPINKVYPLAQLIKACKDYIKATNRRLTFEYIMIDGVNDRPDDARQLAGLIRGMNAYVNLIPYNATDETHQRTNSKNLLIFYDILKKSQINGTIRREFGSNIDAACGQLRARNEECK